MIGPPVARTGAPRLSPAVACKRDAAYRVLVEMRLHLDDQRVGSIPLDDEGLIDPRKRAVKGNVDHSPSDGGDDAGMGRQSYCHNVKSSH